MAAMKPNGLTKKVIAMHDSKMAHTHMHGLTSCGTVDYHRQSGWHRSPPRLLLSRGRCPPWTTSKTDKQAGYHGHQHSTGDGACDELSSPTPHRDWCRRPSTYVCPVSISSWIIDGRTLDRVLNVSSELPDMMLKKRRTLCDVSTTPLLALQPSPRLLFPFLQHPMEHRAQPQNPAAVSNPITSNNPSTSMRFTHQSHHQPLERVKAASVRVIVGMGTRFIRFDHLPYPHPHLRVIAGHPRHRWPRPLSKVLAGRYPRSR